MKKWMIPLAVLAVLPAVGAALPATGPVGEQLVEGHTVFTVIEAANTVTEDRTEYAAAVAVLVRETNAISLTEKFPGVLWFNDQYLVDPEDNSYTDSSPRYPCNGAVLAVNQGDPNPVDAFDPALNGGVPPTYVESYMITDPNDHAWNVDKWEATGGTGTYNIWTVALLDFQAGYDQADSFADNCAPFQESSMLPGQSASVDTGNPTVGTASANAGPCFATSPDAGADTSDPGTTPANPYATTGGSSVNAQPARCNDESYITPGHTSALKYNAVLYFFLDDLLVTDGTIKNHHSGAAAPGDDVSGCQDTDPAFDDQWPCPAGDDNAEGNSHPYNPFYATTLSGAPICGFCVGGGNHGGSGDGSQYSHATRQIDLYYGAAQAPVLRQFRVTDTEGSTAPFFCEDDFAVCLPQDLS